MFYVITIRINGDNMYKNMLPNAWHMVAVLLELSSLSSLCNISLRNPFGPWPWDSGTAISGLGKLGKLVP